MGTQLIACKECGEDEHIYFKHVYMGAGRDVWIVECQGCGNLVPAVSYRYDSDELATAWNKANDGAAQEG